MNSLYTPLRTDSREIRLISIPYGGKVDGVTYVLEHFSINDETEYELLECMLDVDAVDTSIKLNGHDVAVSEELKTGLAYLTDRSASCKIWIESVCINREDVSERNQQESLKKTIHTNAKGVVILAGRDHVENDTLNAYLGPGCSASTKYAFDFATALAAAEFTRPALRSVIEGTVVSSGRPGWCCLARLLYRPWFRQLPILGTNYVAQLSEPVVLCGTTSVPWPTISAAADRIRAIQPLPQLIQEENEQDTIWPGMSVEQGVRWIIARERFGFKPKKLAAQLIWMHNKYRGTDETKHSKRLSMLLGMVVHHCNIDTDHPSFGWEMCEYTEGFDKLSIDESAPVELDAIPSLPHRAWASPAPPPEWRAPFVHPKLIHDTEIRLLKLKPHDGDYHVPIQCCLFYPSREKPIPFAYVLNATLKNYRQSSLILVNGQSFRVPKALEVFLRRMRNMEYKLPLFIWKICHNPEIQNIQFAGAIEAYAKAKKSILSKATETIDMYSELEAVGENEMPPLLNGMTKDEWLLDLMDEAEVNEMSGIIFQEEGGEENREESEEPGPPPEAIVFNDNEE